MLKVAGDNEKLKAHVDQWWNIFTDNNKNVTEVPRMMAFARMIDQMEKGGVKFDNDLTGDNDLSYDEIERMIKDAKKQSSS